MNFEEYQKLAKRTASYPKIEERYVYPVLGLAGEAGELSNKVKKIFRDDKSILTAGRKEEIKKELGDILWYVSEIASVMGLSLDDVAKDNIEKLASRLERNKIQGNGDKR